MNVPVKQEKKSLLKSMAAMYEMEPQAFANALKATVVPKNISNEEFAAFLMVAKEYALNPLTREIYAFRSKKGGIQPIVSIDGWMHLINSHPQMDGLETEDIVDADGNLIAVTARIYRKDRRNGERPAAEVTEYMAECAGPPKDKNGNLTPWGKYPRRMLRHKAAIQAARYAFGFAGIVDEDEARRMDTVSVSMEPPTPPDPPREIEAYVVEDESDEAIHARIEVAIASASSIEELQERWEAAAEDFKRLPAEYRSELHDLLQSRLDELRGAGEPDESEPPIISGFRAAMQAATSADDAKSAYETFMREHGQHAPPEVVKAIEAIYEARAAELS